MTVKEKKKYTTVTTPVGLLSYPKIATPGESKYDLNKYGSGLFISEDDLKSEAGKAFMLAMYAEARKYTGDQTITLANPNGFRFPIVDCSKLSAEKQAKLPKQIKASGKRYFAIKTRGKFKPGCVGKDGKTKLTDAEIASIQGGNSARAKCSIAPYTIELDGSKGLSLWPNGFQIIDTTNSFRGAVTFEEIEVKAAEMEADLFG